MPSSRPSLRGLSPLRTGLLLLPLALTAGIVSPFSGVLHDRLGARPILLAGFGLPAGVEQR